MTRRYVNQLRDNEKVEEIYRVSDKQLRPNKNGNLYLQCNLSDKTGMISARLWNATEEMFMYGVTNGQSHYVSCGWVSGSTTARSR